SDDDLDHRGLPSFPTRRSSDLQGPRGRPCPAGAGWKLFSAQTHCDARLTLLLKPRQKRFAAAGPERAAPLQRCGQFNPVEEWMLDRKSTRLNSSHVKNSYAVFC